jgi:predicted Fe-Mo cluster-binding NifX family protein
MIIGIPSDDGINVSEHFGRSERFLLAEVKGAQVLNKNFVDNPHNKEVNEQSGHGKLLKMLVDHNVNKVICFNLNPRMQKNLESLGITVERCGIDSKINRILQHLK